MTIAELAVRFRTLTATTVFRWTLAIAAGFTTMALALFAFIYWQTALYERDRIDALILSEARLLADSPGDKVAARLELWLAEDLHNVRYGALFSADAVLATGNVMIPPNDLPADWRMHRAVIGAAGRDRDGDAPEIVRGVALRLPDGRLIVLGYDIDGLEQVQGIIVRALGLGVAPAVLLSVLGGTILALRGQKRIAAVHTAVGRIMQGHLRERLPKRGSSDELDKMACAVNGMLDEIERLVTEIRGVGDSMAHDLRTPLTRVRTRLERSRDEALTREEFQAATDRSIIAVDQALAVVSAVLRIGEIEHGRRRAAFTQVDLLSILQEAVDFYEPLADERAIGLRLLLQSDRPPGQRQVSGDSDLLLEAIGNLLDNAIKFAPAGTDVVITLQDRADGLAIRIADSGPGIPPAERERVLQRFYRVEKSRSVEGSGLGLSLVAAVATLHGFGLTIEGARPGCIVEMYVRHTTHVPADAEARLA